jgi:D-amino-acid oxidase
VRAASGSKPAATVVGAGVIGLTCAHALREAGHRVTVIAPDRPSVSEVAGGLWLPYAAGESDDVMRWAMETLPWLERRGHRSRPYLHLEREEPWWLQALAPHRARPARRDELPAGYERGWLCSVPLVAMGRHLDSLRLDVIIRATVASLDEIPGLVVNCTGFAARELAGDALVVAERGQVAYVRARPDTPCLCDEDEFIYVLPREDVCVVGGSSERGDEDDTVRDEQTALLVSRASRIVPELALADVIGARAGLRPTRTGGPRVERVDRVIHCYGHGGAGVTLSWGCAEEVARLAAQ